MGSGGVRGEWYLNGKVLDKCIRWVYIVHMPRLGSRVKGLFSTLRTTRLIKEVKCQKEFL